MSPFRLLIWVLLIGTLIVSALSVIYNKYQTRLLFFEIQQNENKLERQAVQLGQLQLEITTLTSENRVEIEAVNDLGLKFPNRKEIIYLKTK
ncbi:MAG: cell division protein FtsL, partial [Methylococcales bacterium]|nr:cell division protein FtsL [Methylococcales bacterium]MCK5926397.1 cell division protein FtsL [Methylococcales bacterium]